MHVKWTAVVRSIHSFSAILEAEPLSRPNWSTQVHGDIGSHARLYFPAELAPCPDLFTCTQCVLVFPLGKALFVVFVAARGRMGWWPQVEKSPRGAHGEIS